MSALPTRTFRVFLHTWAVYDANVEANSSGDAISKAEALYNAEGMDAFSHHDSGHDGYCVEEDLS